MKIMSHRWIRRGVAQLTRARDLFLARQVELSENARICLLLGPYRNLTTLTASTLALHPHVQVLNHAGARIFGDARVDFLLNFSDRKLQAFAQYAVQISKAGRRGTYGGSILHAHAFDRSTMRALYDRRFGDSVCKAHIDCLVWKESLSLAHHIRTNEIDLVGLLQKTIRLRVLYPIRNPLDCAISNFRGPYRERFNLSSDEASLEDVLFLVLKELAWFLDIHSREPNSCYFFYEDIEPSVFAKDMSAFLDVELDAQWLEDTISVWNVKSSYTYSDELVRAYRNYVTELFEPYPEVTARLLQFASQPT